MNYRNIDFSKAYAESIGYHIVKGQDIDTIALMVPFLLLDCALDIFTKKVAAFPMQHNCSRYRKMWRAAYDRFNQRAFRAFSSDMQDAFIDKMDDYHDFISHHLTIAQIQCENIFKKDYAGADLELLGALLLINELTVKASTLYTELCHDVRLGRRYSIHPDLRDMLNAVKLLAAYFMDRSSEIPENYYKQFVMASDIISKKTVEWVGIDDEASRARTELLTSRRLA